MQPVLSYAIKASMASSSSRCKSSDSHRSTLRCRLSQYSADVPNRRLSRIAISVLTARRSRTTSFTDWRYTPKRFASDATVNP